MTGPLAAVVGMLVAMAAVAGAILVLLIGATCAMGFGKLRLGRETPRSLDELVGEERFARLLPASAPRGPVDQLRVRELQPPASRHVE